MPECVSSIVISLFHCFQFHLYFCLFTLFFDFFSKLYQFMYSCFVLLLFYYSYLFDRYLLSVYHHVLGTVLSIFVSLLWSYFTKLSFSFTFSTHRHTHNIIVMCLIRIFIRSHDIIFLVLLSVFHLFIPLSLPTYLPYLHRSCVLSFLIIIHLWVKWVLLVQLFVGGLFEGEIETLFQE